MWFIGNWKMNGSNLLIEGFLNESWADQPHSIAICPPNPYLKAFKDKSGLLLGAQDCHDQSTGAYTGEVSAKMLKECGVDLVLLGHSERRIYNNEMSEQISRKADQALIEGVLPVICVGEPLNVREEGQAISYVLDQLATSMPSLKNHSILVAYEPVWAIGTGLVPSLDDIQRMHQAIKGIGVESVLYGGSVNEQNAKEILSLNDVDGVLVGGASLAIKPFKAIVQAV